MRVVIDPGVLVSGLIVKGGVPDRVQRAAIRGSFTLVMSPRLLRELETVLVRPKFRAYVTADDCAEYLERLRACGELVDDPHEVEAVLRDPDDDYLVAMARTAAVDVIVSGDGDLLEAGLDKPPVWTPRQLLEALERQAD